LPQACPGALQLAHGPGETVGAALVAAPGIGRCRVYRLNRSPKSTALAAKDGAIVPLIARNRRHQRHAGRFKLPEQLPMPWL
jgi:hypothetical protein